MDQFREEERVVRDTKTAEDINLLKLIESRILEIIHVENDIKKKYPQQFQQRLPRFMRRRAASHNVLRLPKKARPKNFNPKDRKQLLKYRLRVRYQKHKRILAKHRRHKYKNPEKCVLHKWFAKRFKMTSPDFIPLHNNTKNYRNLYRQMKFGCAYISLAHLIAIKITSPYETATLERLNRLALSISGFTFFARALESKSRYELAIHLYEPSADRKYICPALVSNHEDHLIMWVPRENLNVIRENLDGVQVDYSVILPRDWTRLRLVGPNSRSEADKIAEDKEAAKSAVEDVDHRFLRSQSFGVCIGRMVAGKDVSFVYYQTNPLTVDVIFQNKRGRLLWHQLIKNKAHLVGGKRDVDNLLTSDCFKLIPDCDKLIPKVKSK